VNGILGIVTASTIPILFVALSRLQYDDNAFNSMFFRIQKMLAYFILPMGAGIYIYSDVATKILLGSQWMEASRIIGIWAVTSAAQIIFGHTSSEVYRSKGNPRLSFLAQVIYLIVLVPTCIISVRYGFWVLVYARALIGLQFIIVHLIIMKYAIKFPIGRIFPNIAKPVLFTLLMCIAARVLQLVSSDFVWSLVSILICMAIYFTLLWLFAKKDIEVIANIFLRKRVA
jgi:O-antigen/teichoic acid export membrane protein